MSVTDLRAVAATVERSVHPEDLYGLLVGPKDEQRKLLNHLYVKLVEIVHPDKYSASVDVEMARIAFVRATSFRDRAVKKIEAGTYGDKTKSAEAEELRVDPDPPPSKVENKKRAYQLVRRYAQGDLADIYVCSYNEPIALKKTNGTTKKSATVWSTLMEPDEDIVDTTPERKAAFKIVASAADNDLLEREAKVLAKLYPADQEDTNYFRYLPKLLDTFEYTKGRVRRRVNVLRLFDDMYPLTEVLATRPNGWDYRDVVWMFKRMLVGLGYVHSKGVVHGSIILPHVLVHPVNHGARLIDWCYSVDGKGHVPAISKAYRDFYPPEVLKKATPTPATDIYMAAKCALAMMGGDVFTGRFPDSVPKPIQSFYASCLIAAPSKRPDDAWKLHDNLVEILEKVVGKAKYRPLEMPPIAKA